MVDVQVDDGYVAIRCTNKALFITQPSEAGYTNNSTNMDLLILQKRKLVQKRQ